MELVASEPVVFDPVDLEFDESGRVFVLEMPGYPFPRTPGRIVRLRDRDGDGLYESRTVFADGFPIAVSILPYRSGLLVASPPDLVFVRDSDADGIADQREVLLSGFAAGNTQHNFNGLTHGLDNWVHGANGWNSGEVFWPDRPELRIPLAFDDFRIRPATRTFERTAQTAGGFGMTFDTWGRSFSTNSLAHISHAVFPGRYLERLPPWLRGSRHQISDHDGGGPARLFPIGIPETRLNHPEHVGRFSAACGITAYTGGAFGAEFDDNVFVADAALNLVHRCAVRPNGASLVASRARPGVEFLASSDRAFRPVNMTVGPDGALYVLDMQRDVIEHPEWIPDALEADLHLYAGHDRGRIYRIAPRSGLDRAHVDLDRSKPRRLVQLLGHPNKWWRDTAQRVIVEEAAAEVIPELLAALVAAENPRMRLHALWTLEGLDALDAPTLLGPLRDAHPRIREHAIVIAESFLQESELLQRSVVALAEDPDPRVRMQVALTVGATEPGGSLDALTTIAAHDVNDPWTRLALLGGLERHAYAGICELLRTGPSSLSDGGRQLLRDLAGQVEADQAGKLLNLLGALRPEDARITPVLEGLVGVSGLSRASLGPDSLGWLRHIRERSSDLQMQAAWRLERVLGVELTREQRAHLIRAGETAQDSSSSTQARLEALALYEFAAEEERSSVLLALLAPQQPRAVQAAAMAQLLGYTRVPIGEQLIAAWPMLGPHTRESAAELLVRRPEYHPALLRAVENGTVTLGELNLDMEQRGTMLRSRDDDVRRRSQLLFTDAPLVTRVESLEAMRPALALQGDSSAGSRLFQDTCARCHRVGGEGTAVGPDLSDSVNKSPEMLLHDIVDPNAAVEPRFVSYTIEIQGGRIVTGLLHDTTPETVTVVEPGGGVAEIEPSRIQRQWTLGLSLMPEGLEAGMTAQDMADLLAFLQDPS